MKYVIGTRKSRLSLAQTDIIVKELKAANEGADYEVQTITTRGDTDARPLFEIDQKGIFEKEIDRQVIEQKVDFAVHSMKDVPSELPAELCLACVPTRESSDDIIITREGLSVDSLDSGATVGTSSLRRAVELRQIRNDLNIVPVRGNIDTRIRKVESKELDAIVLARAGIARLNLDTKFHTLDADTFLPSPGQGALGLVARADDKQTISMLQRIQDSDSRAEIDAERALSNSLESGCRFPVGARAICIDSRIDVHAVAFSVDGTERIDAHTSGTKEDAAITGDLAGKELHKRGVAQLALNWRAKVSEWNSK